MPGPTREYGNSTPVMTTYASSNDQRRHTRRSYDLTRTRATQPSSNDPRRIALPSPPSLRTQTHSRRRSFSTASSASTLVDSETTHIASGSRQSMHRPSSSVGSSRMHITKPPLSALKESRRSDDFEIVPPAYAMAEPPSYSRTGTHAGPEPRTLPMYLFIFGFLCPLLWIVGTFTMRLPHRERRGPLDPFAMAGLPAVEKAAAEREIERITKKWEAEMRWAKRCMWASVLFVSLGLAAGMTTWGAMINRRSQKVTL